MTDQTTQCARRPFWEIVSTILSEKQIEVAVVDIPVTLPVADLVRAGKGVGTGVDDSEDMIFVVSPGSSFPRRIS